MKEILDIKITRINDRFHARLSHKDYVIDEMACKDKQDISLICSEMLRWADKLGYISPMAIASRKRELKNPSFPIIEVLIRRL